MSGHGRGLLIRNTIRGPVLQPQSTQPSVIEYRSVSLSVKRRRRGRPARLLSPIHALLGDADNARKSVRFCLEKAPADKPFFLEYVYEALAR